MGGEVSHHFLYIMKFIVPLPHTVVLNLEMIGLALLNFTLHITYNTVTYALSLPLAARYALGSFI